MRNISIAFRKLRSKQLVQLPQFRNISQFTSKNVVPTQMSSSPMRCMSTTTDNDQHEGPTIFDIEKEMFQIRRKMTTAYASGRYQLSLEFAQELEQKAIDLMGKRNAVYASCLNNVALMYKMLGEQDKALETYTAALHVYMDIAGKEHVSYAATLSNLGVLYKEMSKGRVISKNDLDGSGDGHDGPVVIPVKGMERQNYLDRAEEALVEARETRQKLLGETHKDTLYSAIHLASLWKLRDKPQDALVLLRESLLVAESTYGEKDVICAALRNDLGVLCKANGELAEAKIHYTKALEIRSKALGDKHNDTVVSVFNLAELLTAMGQTEEAQALQEALIQSIETRQEENAQATTAHTTTTVPAPEVVSTSNGDVLRVHKQVNSFSSPTTTTTATTMDPTLSMPEKIDAVDIVRREEQRQENVTLQESERKPVPVTYANRVHKPATRRKSSSNSSTSSGSNTVV